MKKPTLFRDSYGDMRLWVVFATAFAAVVVLIVGVVLLLAPFAAASCGTQWADFTHRWELIGGCLVEYEDIWYPADVVRTLIK